MGHRNVATHVAKFDEATWHLRAAIGLTPSRLRTPGVGMAGVGQLVEYKRELFAGDIVTVTSAVVEIQDKSIRVVHEMPMTRRASSPRGWSSSRCTWTPRLEGADLPRRRSGARRGYDREAESLTTESLR